jgi:hypothetical protein
LAHHPPLATITGSLVFNYYGSIHHGFQIRVGYNHQIGLQLLMKSIKELLDIDGVVMIFFTAALKGDVCVFRSALDDLAAGLPAQRICGAGNHLLGLSDLPIFGTWGAVPRRRIWFSRALGSSQGWVFVGDGDELSDSSMPPLTPVRTGLIAQQLLCHGKSLRRGQLTPRTSARSSGGGERERRLCMPGREVGGLQIFLLFLVNQDVLVTEDGLGLSPNSVAVVKTLEPCVGIGHVEADLEENTP